MKKKTSIVELVISDENEPLTIDAISLVTSPALETDFVYFSKEKNNLTFAKVDEEKRELISPALIPNKQVFRYDPNTDSEYYVYFSKETVKKSAYLYLKHNNHHKATEQHNERVSGVLTVESWIKEGDQDKSNLYGFDLPVGTWFVKMKIENDELWQKIKSGELKGLSIEGYFVNKMEQMSKKEFTTEEVRTALKELLSVQKIELGLVDDLKKSNSEGKVIAANVLKEGEKIAKLYDSIRDEVSNYTKLNDAYEKEIKKAKDSWKNHGSIMDDILLQANELGIKALDIPQYKEAVGIAKELRIAGNDTVRYPSVKI